MAPGKVVHVVQPMRLQHVRLQHGVVRDAGEHDAVVGEYVLVVLDVLPELFRARILEPRLEPRKDGIQRQL